MGAYHVTARNFSAATENKIHSDEIARKYGFEGALVPGVAVYGHLTYPLVERFGEDWLASSESSLRLLKPAYDQNALTVALEEDGDRFVSRVTNDAGVLLAELDSAAPGTLSPAESLDVFDASPREAERVEMAWDTIKPWEPFPDWHVQITEDGNKTYTEQISDPLQQYRYLAHPHWLLGIANRALTREYEMPAWIHVGSDIRLRSLVRVGDTLTVRAVPLEKWERKGHQFIKLYVAYLRGPTLTTEIFHTAIFRVAA